MRSSTPLIVQTVVDYTTGTVATTAGSTTITFSATIANSKTGQYIKTSSSEDWYKISAHTAGSASATLDIAALNTAAAATYTIRKVYYSTDSTVDRILAIKQTISPFQLAEVGKEYFEEIFPRSETTGSPRYYMMAGLDSSNYPQFILWPSPDAAINLYVDYIKTATDLSADADVSVIPAKWHTSVLLEGAKWQGFTFLDDTRAKDALLIFNAGIEEMKANYPLGKARHRVTRPIDSQPGWGQVRLPYNYPSDQESW